MGFRLYIYQDDTPEDKKYSIVSPKLYGYVEESKLVSVTYFKRIIKEFDYDEICYSESYGLIKLTEGQYKIFLILYLNDLFGDELNNVDSLNWYSKEFIEKSRALLNKPGDKYLEWG